jgi:hypothetical protein
VSSGLTVAMVAAVGTAALALIVVCWKSRTVLGGVLGAVAIALVVVALTMKPTGGARGSWLGVALAVLLIGVVLYVLGRFADRLLDEDPDARS